MHLRRRWLRFGRSTPSCAFELTVRTLMFDRGLLVSLLISTYVVRRGVTLFQPIGAAIYDGGFETDGGR